VAHSNDKAALLKILVKTSLRVGGKDEFHLSSGKSSEFYVDCKMAISHPPARKLMGKLIAEAVHGEKIDAVGGLEIGAYPIAAAVSDAIYEASRRSVLVFVVRKQAKAHGLKKWVEGDIPESGRALIVDDVTTTGTSVISAIDRARESGMKVDRAILLVDREEPEARHAIEAKGVRFDALFTLTELKDALDDAKRSDAHAHSARAVAG
jgi:orotate phosphoribosyltransferase